MSVAVSPISWFGGKQGLARRIAALLPPHRAYIEAFGGGGSVLFVKEPSKLDVYNDKDGGVVTFFRVLRDRHEELAELLYLTPYSRAEYLLCRETWKDVDDELERVRRWFVTTWQAFGGGGKEQHRTGWAYDRTGRKNGSRPRTFSRRVEQLHEFAHRLRHVQIEQLDWRDCLERYDSAEACLYLDPPYLPSTRSTHGKYAHELTELEHQELVEAAIDAEAAVVVSGYESELYLQLDTAGFDRYEFDVALAAAFTEGKRQRRREIVWRRGRRGDTERLFL